MELKTEAVDRLLDALTPTLAVELGRVVEETRQTLEAEFESRLLNAVTEAEAKVRAVASDDLARELENTIVAVREQVTAELQSKMDQMLVDEQLRAENSLHAIEDSLRAARDEADKLKADSARESERVRSEWDAERTEMQQQIDLLRVLAEAPQQLQEAGSQPEILLRWLKLAEPFAASVALYTAKADGLALWKGRGSAVFPEIISQQTTDPDSYFKPIVVRDKVVAAVCAIPPFEAEALDFLIGSVERSIELFGLKLRTGTARVP